MFILKNFNEEDLEIFFDIFTELGITEIEADYMGQGNTEEFNFYCWTQENEELDVTDNTECPNKHKEYIQNNHDGNLSKYLNQFLRSCIPLDYKDNFGSFGMIKFKMEERDYEIIKFEYSSSLEDY